MTIIAICLAVALAVSVLNGCLQSRQNTELTAERNSARAEARAAAQEEVAASAAHRAAEDETEHVRTLLYYTQIERDAAKVRADMNREGWLGAIRRVNVLEGELASGTVLRHYRPVTDVRLLPLDGA